MSLSDIVQVTITAQTAAPSRIGFGLPLIMAYHTAFPERAREYTGIAAMISDGFPTTHPAVRMASSILGQNPKPAKVIVGREVNTQKMKIKLTPNEQNSTDYSVVLNGLTATFTSDATATVLEICAGLKTQIDALAQSVTVTDNTTDIDIQANTVADAYSLNTVDRTLIEMNDITPDGTPDGIAADIAAVKVENDDWFTCHLTNQGKAVITAAAAYIETLYKVLMVATPDTDTYDSVSITDIAANLQTAGYARTALMYHPKANLQYPAAAWAGRCLPLDAGSITWMFKTLSGVDYVNFTTTEESTLKGKDCNMYVRISGISMTQEGKTSAGSYIDLARGTDFIRARLQEYVFGALARADKIPFTDAGAAVVEAEVKAVMSLSVNQTILAADPAPVVSVPLVKDVSATDKANRLLPDVTFTATFAGAIHGVQISGTISV